MLGKQSDQRGLLEASNLYIDHVGRGSFYGLLASLRGQLFRDEEFAELYCTDNGRDSVPPSLLATALITGLATAPAGSCSAGSSGQGSRPGQRLVHLDQSCPDHPLDVARQGLEIDGEPDPLAATYP